MSGFGFESCWGRNDFSYLDYRERAVDICVRMKAGQFELIVVIDCKDYSRKVNVKDVEEVMGICQDVGANQGAIVTARGFSDGAMKRARDAKMNLYTLIDAESHEWQTLVTIPILVEVRGIESVRFTFSSSAAGPFRMDLPDWEHLLELELFLADGSRALRSRFSTRQSRSGTRFERRSSAG